MRATPERATPKGNAKTGNPKGNAAAIPLPRYARLEVATIACTWQQHPRQNTQLAAPLAQCGRLLSLPSLGG